MLTIAVGDHDRQGEGFLSLLSRTRVSNADQDVLSGAGCAGPGGRLAAL